MARDRLCLDLSCGPYVAGAVFAFAALFAACTSSGEPETRASREPETEDEDEDEKEDAGSKPRKDGSTGTSRDSGTAGSKDSSSPAPAKDGGMQTSSDKGLPCDVQAIVAERCGACHGESTAASAPMSLTTPAHFQEPGPSDDSKKVHELVKTRINATTKPMPPTGKLSADELATLNAWLDDGAPGSEDKCESSGDPPDPNDIDTSELECVKLLAHAQGDKNAKFKVGAVADAYWKFGFRAPWQGLVYGRLVKPVIDNAKVLHHWLLYRDSTQDGAIVATIGQGSGELVAGWAPGGTPLDFRPYGDVSFELPSENYAVEFHYNSDDPNAMDASGVELCFQKEPTENIASLSWLGYDHGGAISYATGICAPADEWVGTCRPRAQEEPIHILFVTPHMHQSGTHMKAVINGASGTRTLHDEAFDFEYQVSYEKNVMLMPGETITTTCNFSKPQCAGQSTSQEMCFLFTYAYPKLTLVDNGAEGRLMHGEGVCLGQ